MEFPRRFALLLMVLEWTRQGLPSPLKPVCDLRVLDVFIKEAQDAEAAMKMCKEGCGLLAGPVTVPQSKVDLSVWESKNAVEKAQEVQSGLWLLNQTISSLRASITNTALHSHIDNSVRNIVTIRQVLRRLNIQEYTPTAGETGVETWPVSSALKLLQVHLNFLRGKVHLLMYDAPACHHDGS